MTCEPRFSVALVAPPWQISSLPSIQIATLASVLRQHGIETTAWYLTVEWIALLRSVLEPRLTLREYDDFVTDPRDEGLAEWVFKPPCDGTPNGLEMDPSYRAHLLGAGVSEAKITRAQLWRGIAATAVGHWAKKVLCSRPSLVGLSTTFSQTWACLALARAIKAQAPETRLILGGANCEGPMGSALLELEPTLDGVVQGEGERAILDICRATDDGFPIEGIPGVLARTSQPRAATGGISRTIVMDSIPPPDYSDYFASLGQEGLLAQVRREMALPIESSRGCWWGVKSHCTFCGLNGERLAFRSKSPERLVSEMHYLSSRHGVDRFYFVDNIMDPNYLRTFLPMLKAADWDPSLFFETKANLTWEQVEVMADAGIRVVQPGIESLSTSILRLMRKGVTALQNIALLKWAAAYAVYVRWNIIIGTPGEPPEEYARMERVAPRLVHLAPPTISRLQLHRFSPYHAHPSSFGIEVQGPSDYYRFIYGHRLELVERLAYSFKFSYVDDRVNPDSYAAGLVAAVEKWNANASSTYRGLTYVEGPDYVRISDCRQPTGLVEHIFRGDDARMYLLCDEGTNVERVRDCFVQTGRRPPAIGQCLRFLEECVANGVMYSEEDTFLSLALPARPHDVRMRSGARHGATVARSGVPSSLPRLRQLRLCGVAEPGPEIQAGAHGLRT
jgi:ribosomal peptide maturation radical SAM protein 1